MDVEQNWIRRENMKIKHGGIDADESGPSDQYNIPKKSSGPWHQFLKEYGKSEGIYILASCIHGLDIYTCMYTTSTYKHIHCQDTLLFCMHAHRWKECHCNRWKSRCF